VALEIERKFLVRDDSWRSDVDRSLQIRQGYFARTSLLRARIRIMDDKAYLALKSEPGSLVRHEFEYEIPCVDAVEMKRRFSIEPIITKTRHCIKHENRTW